MPSYLLSFAHFRSANASVLPYSGSTIQIHYKPSRVQRKQQRQRWQWRQRRLKRRCTGYVGQVGRMSWKLTRQNGTALDRLVELGRKANEDNDTKNNEKATKRQPQRRCTRQTGSMGRMGRMGNLPGASANAMLARSMCRTPMEMISKRMISKRLNWCPLFTINFRKS